MGFYNRCGSLVCYGDRRGDLYGYGCGGAKIIG